MNNLAGVLLLGMLTACAPRVTNQSTLAAQAIVQGQLLTVAVMNTGPYDLLLQDGCPRPFAIGYTTLPAAGGRTVTNEDQPCLATTAPPLLWRVGERLTSSMTLALQPGTLTLQAWARPRVRLAPFGKAQGEVRELNVSTPAFTLTTVANP